MQYIKENMEITDLYKIYIGSDNKSNKINAQYMGIIEEKLNSLKVGYTIIKADGLYQGIKEDSIIIEIIDFNTDKTITDIPLYYLIKNIAEDLKEDLKQFQILITKSVIKYEVI